MISEKSVQSEVNIRDTSSRLLEYIPEDAL